MVAKEKLCEKYEERKTLINCDVIDINKFSELQGEIYFLEEYIRCRK